MKNYYGVEYYSGRRTTTGEPNRITGRMSIACKVVSFRDKTSRSGWVAEGATTCDMAGNCRESIRYADVRKLMLGDTVAEMWADVEEMGD